MNSARIQWLEKFAKDDPSDPFPRYALALEWSSEEPGKALTMLDQLLTQHPEYIPAYYQTARLMLSTGKASDARPVLEKGIRLAAAASESKTVAELKSLLDDLE